jgi:hypothetical protein
MNLSSKTARNQAKSAVSVPAASKGSKRQKVRAHLVAPPAHQLHALVVTCVFVLAQVEMSSTARKLWVAAITEAQYGKGEPIFHGVYASPLLAARKILECFTESETIELIRLPLPAEARAKFEKANTKKYDYNEQVPAKTAEFLRDEYLKQFMEPAFAVSKFIESLNGMFEEPEDRHHSSYTIVLAETEIVEDVDKLEGVILM